jgi:molybdenum cofactor sulfurtransferase
MVVPLVDHSACYHCANNVCVHACCWIDTIYLDHTGTTLYPASTIEAFSRNLQGALYGNPHSRHESSERTAAIVDQTRLAVLSFLNADPAEYSVVFTSNATAALRLCCEICPLERDRSEYRFLRESHTSVVGLRGIAEAAGVQARPVDASEVGRC